MKFANIELTLPDRTVLLDFHKEDDTQFVLFLLVHVDIRI